MRISPTPIAAAPVLLPAALLGLGCGDDDSGGGSAAPPSEARDVPSDAGELKER